MPHPCPPRSPRRPDLGPAARLVHAPGRALPARVPGAAGHGARLHHLLPQSRDGGRGDAAADAPLSAGCGHRLRRHPADPAGAGPEGLVRGRRGAAGSARCRDRGAWREPIDGAGEPLATVGETLSLVRAAAGAGAGADRLRRRALDRGDLHDRGPRQRPRGRARTLAYAEPGARSTPCWTSWSRPPPATWPCRPRPAPRC